MKAIKKLMIFIVLFVANFTLGMIKQQPKVSAHLPCLFLIDMDKYEKPTDEGGLQPLTNTLGAALAKPVCAIITTSWTLFNLIERIHNVNDPRYPQNKRYLSSIYFTDNDWDAYEVPGSQFLIFIPKNNRSLFQQGFNVENLPAITSLLPQKPEREYAKLSQWLKEIKLIAFNSNQLDKIFKKQTSKEGALIWDFIINGHGGAPDTLRVIAGLSIDHLNEIFSFFDRHLSVGIVYLLSCYAGGQNSNLLQIQKSDLTISHNFILIIGSIGDYSIASEKDIAKVLHDFFSLSASIKDKGTGLNELLKTINTFNIAADNPHGAENIPQVWLPRGLGFQTFNIDARVLSLNKVMVAVHEDTKKPILVKDKRAVLVYPIAVDVPMIVSLYKLPEEGTEIETKAYETWKSMPVITNYFFWKKFTDKIQDIFTQIENDPNFPTKASEAIENLFMNSQFDQYIYPQFIGMVKAPTSSYYFSRIEVLNNQLPTAGILRFIRDAFLNVGQRHSGQEILIDEITGYNDIFTLLRASRALKNITQPHPLEDMLRPHSDQIIMLKKVSIFTSYASESKQNWFSISFEFNGTFWFFNAELANEWEKSHYWNFQSTDAAQANEYYSKTLAQIAREADRSGQKRISTTLQGKLRKIETSKTFLQPKKEAAELAIKKYKEAAAKVQSHK